VWQAVPLLSFAIACGASGAVYVSLFCMANMQTRRNFLWTAPLAAAVTLPLTDTLLHGSTASLEGGQAADAGPHTPFQVFPASTIESMVKSLEAAPGAKDIVSAKDIAVTMTVSAEEKKAGKEFEFHEHRDHVFLVLDGTTRYEVGGTPKNARQTKPGEWLAPESEGFTAISLKKGDYLMIPRMTPHKRITDEMVSLMLISATTPSA
jgi:mannose-6-phosphate isomerase-like protein (cupin superfamily)